MSDIPMYSVSVAGVTVDDMGHVLLICRRDNGEWQAPGGILELGETFEDGVRREVFEETGLRVEVQYLTGVYKNMLKNVVALVYRCRPDSGCLAASDEAAEIEWVTPTVARGRMSPAFWIRVKDAISVGNVAASRAHDGVDLL